MGKYPQGFEILNNALHKKIYPDTLWQAFGGMSWNHTLVKVGHVHSPNYVLLWLFNSKIQFCEIFSILSKIHWCSKRHFGCNQHLHVLCNHLLWELHSSYKVVILYSQLVCLLYYIFQLFLHPLISFQNLGQTINNCLLMLWGAPPLRCMPLYQLLVFSIVNNNLFYLPLPLIYLISLNSQDFKFFIMKLGVKLHSQSVCFNGWLEFYQRRFCMFNNFLGYNWIWNSLCIHFPCFGFGQSLEWCFISL